MDNKPHSINRYPGKMGLWVIKAVRAGFIFLLAAILLLPACGGKGNKSVSVTPEEPEGRKQEANYYPAWILNPSMGGCLGAVGMAKKQNNTARSQQWVAEKVAMAELSKQFEILVESVCRSKKEERFSDELLIKYEEELNCVSIQESEHVFSVYSHDPVIKDRWIEPVSGDMYVWAVLPVSE